MATAAGGWLNPMRPEYVSIQAHLIRELAKKYGIPVPDVEDAELVEWFKAYCEQHKQHTENDDA